MRRTGTMERVTFRDVCFFVWRYWCQAPVLFAGVGATVLAATLCDVLIPLFAGRLIDSLTEQVGSEAVAAAIAALTAFIGLAVFSYAARQISYKLWIRLATRVMRRIVTDAFTRVQRYSTDWHANSFAGATVRKVSRGMWANDEFADTLVLGLFPAVVVVVGATLMLSLHWPLMGGYVLAASAVYVTACVALSMSYVAPANRLANEADSAIGAAMADAIGCNAAIKSFGAEQREENRFLSVAERWRASALKSWGRQTDVEIVQSALTVLLQVGLLGLALMLWARGEASAGDVTFVMTSYFVVNGYLREIGMHVRAMQRAVNELDDIVGFSHMEPAVADRPGARQLVVPRGEVAFDRVTFRYANQDAPIYSDFSLTITPGEKVALVGHSGSGKSTFVKLVQRLYDLDGGRILLDGQDIATATQDSVRRAIALVPQEPVLFHRSLAENIAYARPDATRQEIEAAADRAHAHAFIRRLPQGYDTLVGERGVNLSGGERQRVALARAFLADAPVLVLDEATSSLDSVTEHLIQDAIEKLMVGRTTIIIAHRLSTIRRVDRILVFKDGAIVEQGSHEALLGLANGHYRELHAVQSHGLIA